MALRRIDGFAYWSLTAAQTAVNAQADGVFVGYNVLTASAPARFNQGQNFNTGINMQAYESVGQRFDTATCVIGHAVYVEPGPSNLGEPLAPKRFGVYDAEGGGDLQWYIQFEETGVIRLYVGADNGAYTLVATSAADVYHTSQWFYLEIKHLIHNTAGMVEVRVNTKTVISYVGKTNNDTPVLGLAYGWDSLYYYSSSPGGAGSNVRYTDRYIIDNTGANNTDYLGNVRVNTQFTVAAGDLTQFSVFGASSNWDAVNGQVLDDTEYVYAGTVGDEDLYTMDPNVTAQNIFGIQVRGAYRQDDATQVTARSIIKTGGTVYEGGDLMLTGNYTYYRDVWELNPNTGVGWTASECNALQAGTKVQAIG